MFATTNSYRRVDCLGCVCVEWTHKEVAIQIIGWLFPVRFSTSMQFGRLKS